MRKSELPPFRIPLPRTAGSAAHRSLENRMERTSPTSSDRRTRRTHVQHKLCAAGRFLFAITIFLGAVLTAMAENNPASQPRSDFERDVQPILASKCVRCHGPQTAEAGLRLDNRKTAIGPLD